MIVSIDIVSQFLLLVKEKVNKHLNDVLSLIANNVQVLSKGRVDLVIEKLVDLLALLLHLLAPLLVVNVRVCQLVRSALLDQGEA